MNCKDEIRAMMQKLDDALNMCMSLEKEVPQFIKLSGKIYNAYLAGEILENKIKEGK